MESNDEVRRKCDAWSAGPAVSLLDPNTGALSISGYLGALNVPSGDEIRAEMTEDVRKEYDDAFEQALAAQS